LPANAGMGEYVAIFKVEDNASNSLSHIAERTIKVK